MPIHFTCENCRRKLEVPDASAGKRGRCNQCGHLNPIPSSNVPNTIAEEKVAAATVLGETSAHDQTSQTDAAAKTFSVKSAVNGAVFGPADSATLRVWLEEGRITADCQLQQTGSEAWTMASAMFPSLGAAAGIAASAASINTADSFAQYQQPSANNETAEDLNPYAPTLSPHAIAGGPQVGTEIVPTAGDIGFCISHGWKTWTQNFGVLLAVSATTFGISMGFNFVQEFLQLGFVGGGDMWLTGAIFVGFALLSTGVQCWLGLGSVKLICQLCRGEKGEYATLFGSAGRLPLLLLLILLFYLPFVAIGGMLFLLIGPDGFQQGPGQDMGLTLGLTVLGGLGLAMFLSLTVWPIYFLLADTKLGFGEVVAKGFSIGLKNFFIIIPIFFVAGLAALLGVLACGIGIVATIPAAQAIVATAYLNMSGQLTPR